MNRGKMCTRKLSFIALVLVLAISTIKSDFNPSEEQYQRYYGKTKKAKHHKPKLYIRELFSFILTAW